jgi:hypothetical protein
LSAANVALHQRDRSITNVTSSIDLYGLTLLVYQPVPLHGLKIANDYNYLSHTLIHLLHILIIVIGLVSNNFSLSIAHSYVFDLYLIKHYILSYE